MIESVGYTEYSLFWLFLLSFLHILQRSNQKFCNTRLKNIIFICNFQFVYFTKISVFDSFNVVSFPCSFSIS